MAESKITKPDVLEIDTITLNDAATNVTGFRSYKRGKVVQLYFNAADIPTNTWTDLGILSVKPVQELSQPVFNANVNGMGRAVIYSGGTVKIYHTLSTNQSFYGISVVYIAED